MINVFEKYIEITEQPDPLTGEVNVEELEFSFSPEWEGLNKIAVFTTLGITKYQAIENGRCYIPESALAGETELGVFGFEMDGENLKKRLSPKPVSIKFSKGSYIRGGDSENIPPTDFEKYVAEIEELIGDIKEVDSIDIVNNHLIVTYTNGEMHDAGVIDGGGGTSDYDDLTNKPSVNGTTLTGNKTSAQLGLQSTLTAGTGIDITNNIISATGGDCKIEILPGEFAQYDGSDITVILADSTLPNGMFTLPSGGEFIILSTDYNGNTETHTMTDKSIFFFDNEVGRACLIGGENPFYYDSNGGGNFVTTWSIEEQIQVDDTPTSGSSNFITSGGVYTALSSKQNTLTFDSTPTAQSNNPVTSAGIKTYVDTAVGDIDTALTGLVSGGGVE